MVRRVHAKINGELDHSEFNSGISDQSYNNYYENDYQQPQDTYNYQPNFEFETTEHSTYNSFATENSYSGSYVDNSANFIGHNNNSFGNADHNFGYNQPSKANDNISFPKVLVPDVSLQDNFGYNSQPNYGSKADRSWISAFGSGGFENEPPLLEELGINFSHIKDKTLSSLNPFRKLDPNALNDADLTGPLLFCFLFGTSLLLTGKVHFGYIYGVATLGWISIFSILNLMTENGVNFYLTASVLGYCLLPMVLLSAIAVLLKLRGIIGLVLGITSVSWCTFSSSAYFVTAFGMQNQQILIAYPIFLLYSCFALMTIF